MTDRDAILAAVRSALAHAPAGATPIPRGYRAVAPPADLTELFVERLEDYGVIVTRCAPGEEAAEVARAVAGRPAVVPADLPWVLAGALVDDGLSAAQLDACEVAVTASELAVAVTGTIVLDHGAGQGRRALSLVPDVHVCVVLASGIVPDVPDAVARLDSARPLTWISGPSATSDIELQRVQGVHGPRTLHVVLVEDAPA